jgi:DNA/RNA endonuclease YhcR with UshA esterase domain
MKKAFIIGFFFALIVLSHSSLLNAQNVISPDAASQFIGQKATVCGTVASATYAARSKGQPTFLDLDRPYPSQIFTVVIFGSDRSKFDKPPEKQFRSKRICVSGLVELYKGKPEIIVHDPRQIMIQSE